MRMHFSKANFKTRLVLKLVTVNHKLEGLTNRFGRDICLFVHMFMFRRGCHGA